MRRFLILVALGIAGTAAAQEPAKADPPRKSAAAATPEPWKLDDGERAARRADPQLNAIRHSIAVSEGKAQVKDDSFIVDGSRNPELLMPTELMSSVPTAYDPYFAAEKRRERWQARGAARLLGEDWVQRLYEIGREYIDFDVEARRLGVKIQSATGTDRAALEQQLRDLKTKHPFCRETADALAAARKAFGRETFDRFLYQCLAPDAYRRTSISPANGYAEMLLWVEGGCQ